MDSGFPEGVRSVPQLVTLSGMDGSGKTVHARMLVDELRKRGVPAVYRRIRFPFLLSVPLLIYARLRGWSYTIWAGETPVGFHGFHGSPLLQRLYPWTLYIDLLVASWFQVRLPMVLGRTVVCDRFILDTMVDLAVALNRRGMIQTDLGHRYTSLTPAGTKAFLLVSKPQGLKERRPELSADPNFRIRLDLYEEFVDSDLVIPLSTEVDSRSAHTQLLTHLSPDTIREAGMSGDKQQLRTSGWYAYIKGSRWPKSLQKIALLVGHWLFQSLLYMNRSEKFLKLLSEALIFGGVFIALVGLVGVLGAAIIAGFLAHSTNFILDAHIPCVLKHVGLEVGEARIREYAKGFQMRASKRPYLQGALVVGSIARMEDTSASDLDVRVIPRPGWGASLRASAFVYAERTRALLQMFPLDIYVSDSAASLASLRESSSPLILCDNGGALAGMFPKGIGPEILDS